MSVFEDSFTDVSGTNLSVHTPTLIAGGTGSGSWTYGSAGNIVISNANRCRSNTGGSGNSAISSASPSSINCDVEADLVVFTTPGSSTLFVGILACAQTNNSADSRQGYRALIYNSAGTVVARLSKLSAGGETVYGTAAPTWVTGGGATAVYHFKISTRDNGSGGATVSLYVTRSDGQYLKSDGTWQAGSIACASATDASPFAAAPGAIVFFDTASGNTSSVHIDNFLVSNAILALTATATLTPATDTQINGSVTASEGVAPYTYQWQRSTSATSGFANLTGQTSTTLADTTAVAGTQYFYRCVVTDSASTQVNTNAIAGKLWQKPVVIGIIGDSISVGLGATDPSPIAVGVAVYLNKLRQFTLGSNQAHSSSTTADWLPGAGTGYLSTAKTAFAAAGVTHVSIMLGTNDSSGSLSTYTSNLSSICSDLVSAGYTVILNYPPFAYGLNDADNQFLYSAGAQIDGLCNGTTILQGDKLAYQYFATHKSELQADGVHPTTTGDNSLGTLWGYGWNSALNGSGGSGGGFVVGSSVVVSGTILSGA